MVLCQFIDYIYNCFYFRNISLCDHISLGKVFFGLKCSSVCKYKIVVAIKSDWEAGNLQTSWPDILVALLSLVSMLLLYIKHAFM